VDGQTLAAAPAFVSTTEPKGLLILGILTMFRSVRPGVNLVSVFESELGLIEASLAVVTHRRVLDFVGSTVGRG
jgi:hypothetical protein